MCIHMHTHTRAHVYSYVHATTVMKETDWREKKNVEEDGKFLPTGAKATLRMTTREMAA